MGCGYISEDKREKPEFGVLHPFKLYAPDYGVDICPNWYYNENRHYFDIYNMMKNANILTLPFTERTIYTTFTNDTNLEMNATIAEIKKKNEELNNG